MMKLFQGWWRHTYIVFMSSLRNVTIVRQVCVWSTGAEDGGDTSEVRYGTGLSTEDTEC